ncbi:MAG: VWA domain-containing protein [Candidatus Acidiferrales bacterium]
MSLSRIVAVVLLLGAVALASAGTRPLAAQQSSSPANATAPAPPQTPAPAASAPAQTNPPATGQQPAPKPGAITGPGIRTITNLVDVQFAVVSKRQKFVTNLQKENFRVLDDGAAQTIDSFSQQTDLPLRIGLLLDTSNSIRERLSFEQDAAFDFLFNVIRRGRDQAFLMTFDDQPEVIQNYTDDLDTLRNAIQRQRAGGGTALYDAIYQACATQMMHPPPPPGSTQEFRRVLVVISDGDDNLSQKSRSEALEMAQRVGVVIYTISTSVDWEKPDDEVNPSNSADRKYHKEGGDLVLQGLADSTGGRAFFPYHVDDLNQSFLDIGDELRSQYSLAYAPLGRLVDGKFHTIKILVDQKDLIVRARAGYYAAPPTFQEP